MKKITAACFLVGSLLAATIFPIAQNAYGLAATNNAHKKVPLSQKIFSGSYDAKLLSHRLIKFDEENGLATSERASKAYGNTDAYFSATRTDCDAKLSNMNYLACANKLLGESFYYQPVAAVSEGWSNRYSDCDLNVYLLMDAMHLAGKEARIVYAPHHALIAYIDEQTGKNAYWETTDNYNLGGPADLQEPFYLKTPSHFYYEPQPFSYAEKLYPALVIDEIKPLERRDDLRLFLITAFPDNPIVQDGWYENKTSITRQDAQILLILLKTDITSVSKRILLANYLKTHYQQEKARFFLSEIADDQCNEACLSLKSQYSFKYDIAQWSLRQMKRIGVVVSLPLFLESIKVSLFIYLLIFIIFAIALGKAKIEVTIKVNKRNSPCRPQHPERRVE